MNAPAIAVEELSLTIGDFHLDRLDFALNAGEILVILGPNGSGKSVTLEAIAGFHRPSAGRVLIAGRDVTALPPERRNVAFLVQNFGLFPHMTVEQNVAIGLRASPGGKRASLPFGDVDKLLSRFDVTQLAQRTPQSLSPGEKQRVAFARALAAAPDVFLFDEPFSALDRHTSDHLRDELLSFLRGLSIPAVFVTHDHPDAMALADKIIVLRGGVIMQAGTADEVFRKPANVFVANFVGVENILAGRVLERNGGYAAVAVGEKRLSAVAPAGLGGEIWVAIPADAVIARPPGNAAASAAPRINRLAARVESVRALGPLATITLDCGFVLKAHVMARDAGAFESGMIIDVEIAADAIHLMAD